MVVRRPEVGSKDPFPGAPVLDALPRAVLVMALDGRIEFWNRAAAEIYGWPASSVVGRSVLDVFEPATGTSVGPELLAAVRNGATYDGDFVVIDQAGGARQIAASVRPICDAAGSVVGMIGVSEDMGAQRAAAEQAEELTERLRLALDAGGLGTFHWDRATGTTLWDDRMEALFGLPSGGIRGDFEAWVELVHPDDRGRVLAALERAIARGAVTTSNTAWSGPTGRSRGCTVLAKSSSMATATSSGRSGAPET